MSWLKLGHRQEVPAGIARDCIDSLRDLRLSVPVEVLSNGAYTALLELAGAGVLVDAYTKMVSSGGGWTIEVHAPHDSGLDPRFTPAEWEAFYQLRLAAQMPIAGLTRVTPELFIAACKEQMRGVQGNRLAPVLSD